MTALALLDYAAVFVFALTGALAASRAQLDVVGFLFLAALTALGGGTLRDVLIDRPLFWIANPGVLAVAGLAAVLVFFTAHLLESRMRTLLWLDGLALAVAVPAGVAAALAQGLGWPIVLVMGMVTGTMGGLLRDVICNEIPVVLRQGELYVSAAFAGSAAALIAAHLGAETLVMLSACAGVTFALRAGSLAFGWRLPVYKTRPPR
jgi:uncharacterized membrane protein YeiH